MRIVVALGGNALLRRGDKLDASIQIERVKAAAGSLAPLARDHDLLICHGNGPQVGMLALESQSDPALSAPYPLDDLVAQTQGMIGYWLAQALYNAGVPKPVLSVVTQTLVDPADPDFTTPTKFVGPSYSLPQAKSLADRYGWTIAADGDSWRRVVASPEPIGVIEQGSITALLDAGTVLICGGGGGAPVIQDSNGQLRGVEAVVDKDFVASLLGTHVHAHRLLVLTDISAVMQDFGTPLSKPLGHLNLHALESLTFPAGSMAPKIEACRRFVSSTGKSATIGALEDAPALFAGTAGTTIAP
jgi:carbamate kinase